MTASLVNKLLHPPTLALKRLAAQNGAGTRIKLIREIFGIDPPSDAPSEPAQADDASTDPAQVPARQDTR
jgi:hypothetical protein